MRFRLDEADGGERADGERSVPGHARLRGARADPGGGCRRPRRPVRARLRAVRVSGGQPPFAGSSGMAVMWAHMHEQPAALRDRGRSFPGRSTECWARRWPRSRGSGSTTAPRSPRRRVEPSGSAAKRAGLARARVAATAREARRRHGACSSPARSRRRRPADPRLRLRRHRLGCAEFGGRDRPAHQRDRGPGPGRPQSTSIAYGEGAVWVLNADDQTISRIDPETKAERRFGTSPMAIGVAAGEGAVWVLNAGSPETVTPVRTVTRIDPDTGAAMTIELLQGPPSSPSFGPPAPGRSSSVTAPCSRSVRTVSSRGSTPAPTRSSPRSTRGCLPDRLRSRTAFSGSRNSSGVLSCRSTSAPAKWSRRLMSPRVS